MKNNFIHSMETYLIDIFVFLMYFILSKMKRVCYKKIKKVDFKSLMQLKIYKLDRMNKID